MEIKYSKQAEKFLKKQDSWDHIEEEEPDAIDLKMLKAIETDPECHEFTNESDIDWD